MAEKKKLNLKEVYEHMKLKKHVDFVKDLFAPAKKEGFIHTNKAETEFNTDDLLKEKNYYPPKP